MSISTHNYHLRLADALEQRGCVVPHQQTREVIFELDPHQDEAITDISNALRSGLSKFSLVHACGTGKSLVASTIVGASQDQYVAMGDYKKKDILLAIDRANLNRLYSELLGIGIDAGRWGDGKKELDRPVIVANIQSLQKSKNEIERMLGPVGLLIGDEADCILTDQRSGIVRSIDPVLGIGLTATPTWPDGRDIETLWGPKISHLPMADAIQQGLIVPPIWKLFQSKIDGDALPVQEGDYKRKELGAAARSVEIHKSIPEVYQLLVPEEERASTLVLVFVPSTDLVELTSAEFKSLYPRLTVHSWTGETISSAARRNSEQEARAGRVQVLVLCEMGGRAIDLPNASVLIDAYSTLSPNKLEQRLSRVLRRKRDGTKHWAAIAQIVPRSTKFRPLCLPDILNKSAWDDAKRGGSLCGTLSPDPGAPLNARVRLLHDGMKNAKISLTIIDELDAYQQLQTETLNQNMTWNERLCEIREWRLTYPDSWPRTSSKEYSEKSLGCWLQNQRVRMTDGFLTDEQVADLTSLGIQAQIRKEKKGKSWEESFLEFKAWQSEHPDMWPSLSSDDESEARLYQWLRRQREKIRDELLDADKDRQLRDLGMTPARKEKSWDERFTELQEWRKLHADSWPKANIEAESSLNIWLQTQRTYMRDGQLNAGQIQQLQNLGVKPAKENLRGRVEKTPWDKNFAQLCQWRTAHPDTWPSRNSNDETEKKLESWLGNQRYKLRDRTLQADQLEKLVNLSVEPANILVSWDERFAEFQLWKNMHPDAWPSENADDENEKSLNLWTRSQRIRLRDKKTTADQAEKLRSFSIKPAEKREDDGRTWEDHFSDLEIWRDAHPDKWPSILSKDEGERNMHLWLAYQKFCMREGSLEPEKVSKLELLGITARERRVGPLKTWAERYTELQEWIGKNGSGPISRSTKEGSSLSMWLSTQKIRMRENQLSADQVESLQRLGIGPAESRGSEEQ